MLRNQSFTEIIIVGVILFFLLFGFGLVLTHLDYFFNKSLIDMVYEWNLKWWYIITWRHYFTWLYANDFSKYLLYSSIICLIATILILLFILAGQKE